MLLAARAIHVRSLVKTAFRFHIISLLLLNSHFIHYSRSPKTGAPCSGAFVSLCTQHIQAHKLTRGVYTVIRNMGEQERSTSLASASVVKAVAARGCIIICALIFFSSFLME